LQQAVSPGPIESTIDDGLPGSFLVGAIVKMWVAHRLDWAGEPLGRRDEELARDVGSERRCLLVNENYHSKFSLYSNPKDSVCRILAQTHIGRATTFQA
jgi:hypothetical protein